MNYIGILTMNPAAKFLRCIESIWHVTASPDVHVIIGLQAVQKEWDDVVQLANFLASRSEAFQQHPTGTFLLNRDNLGCAGGRNKIVETAVQHGLKPDDAIIFLDDDLYAMNRWVWMNKLTEPLFTGRADIAGVQGMRVNANYLTVPDEYQPDYVSGGWCAVAGRVFLSGIRFDERFNPNYWEDVDLCFQARARGFRIEAVGDNGLVHEQHPGNAGHFEQSRARFAAKWE